MPYSENFSRTSERGGIHPSVPTKEYKPLSRGPEKEKEKRTRGQDSDEGKNLLALLGNLFPQETQENLSDSTRVIECAKKYLGTHESTGQADKFLMGMEKSSDETPWCAGFVSYVLKEAGYTIQPTLSSKDFIGGSGLGHVAFNVGNGQMLGGNQGDQVSIAPIKNPIQGWIMPEEYAAGNPAHTGGEPPIGAILVFDRQKKDKSVA